MTDRPTNNEREELIADARGGAFDAWEAAELPLLMDILADPSTWAEPGAGLEEAIVHAVAEAEPTTKPARASAARRTPRRRRRRRLLVSALAAAAAIMAIVVATVVVTRGGTSPDYEARLTATGPAPGARGEAEITRNDAGFQTTLHAEGLPALRPGEFYQAWLKNAGGTLVPIGTFSSSEGQVTLWSGVSPKDFPTLTVTIETADNDQSSSGRRVLTGEVHAT